MTHRTLPSKHFIPVPGRSISLTAASLTRAARLELVPGTASSPLQARERVTDTDLDLANAANAALCAIMEAMMPPLIFPFSVTER